MPVNRSLAINYPHDDKVYHNDFHHQYLFGPCLLIAPVESWKDFIKVHLPQGKWYDLFTDKEFPGGETIVECPAEKLPVFVKGSSILVIDGETHATTKEKSQNLEIHIYYGTEKERFTLYQDDGTTFNHENGDYNTQQITFDPESNEIIIEKPVGKYPSQYTSYTIYFHGFEKSLDINVNGKQENLSQQHYRFLQPLRSFDPVVLTNTGYLIRDLPFVSTSCLDRICISW
jgi:alpha-glucosidase